MGIEDKARATAKDGEGKLQAAAGDLSGDEAMKLEGEAKQLQAKGMGTAADLKVKALDAAEAIGEAFKGLRGKDG